MRPDFLCETHFLMAETGGLTVHLMIQLWYNLIWNNRDNIETDPICTIREGSRYRKLIAVCHAIVSFGCMHHVLQNKRKKISKWFYFFLLGVPEINYVIGYCLCWGRLFERQHVFTNLIRVILVLELLYNRSFVKASQSKHKKIFQAITTAGMLCVCGPSAVSAKPCTG